MERFAIVVDSSADLTQEQYDAMHIDGFIPLSFSIDGKEYLSYPDERELTAEELYATLRNTKAVVGTSQPNPGRIEDALEALLRQGKDVLYIAFTSGLSGTCASAQLVAEDLRERYPGQKLFVVDTLCACCGVAALIEPVVKMREAGCSIEDARDWLEGEQTPGMPLDLGGRSGASVPGRTPFRCRSCGGYCPGHQADH